jgi:HEAT repeat protein
MTRLLPALALVLLLAPPALAETPHSPLAAYDEAMLRQAGVGIDAESLLKLLREQTRADGDPKKTAELIALLGSDDFLRRERATKDLIALGRPALAALRQARKNDADPEVRLRAAICADAIDSSLDPKVTLAAVRRLVHLRAAGAAGPLLTLLPDVDWQFQDEIVHGLRHVVAPDGKADPAALAALADRVPLRRGAAALAVALAGGADDRARVRKLLADSDPTVRLRAAQGLLAARDDAALPVLIELLNEPAVEVSWPAEELLHWVAGDAAPAAKVGAASAAERRKAADAWAGWHKSAAKPDWDLIDQAPGRPGLCFVCDQGRVWLCGCDGKPRWTVPDCPLSHDVILLPGNEIVLAPFGDGLVVKRDLAGKELWRRVDRNQDDCMALQRLPNGHIFLATDEDIAEVDADGRQVAMFNFQDFNPGDAWMLRDGRILVRHDDGLAELDGFTGRVVRDAPVERVRNSMMNKFAVLPDGRCALADARQNRVVEVDRAGKVTRSIGVRGAWSVEALRDGHYLVATNRDARVIEIDAAGHTVWEAYTRNRPIRVRSVLDTVRVGFDKPRPADFDLDSVASRVRGLKDPDAPTRRRAALFLSYLRPADAASVAALVAALDDPAAEVRTQAGETLGVVGEPAVPALVETLKKGTANGRVGASLALLRMGPAAKPAVPDLTALLADGKMDAGVRRGAAATLGAVGPGAKGAVPALLKALKGDDDQLRRFTAQALPSIAPDDPAVIAGIIAAMKDADYPAGRLAAVGTLATLGPRAKAAVPDLIAVVKAEDAPAGVRDGATTALGAMAAEAKAAVPPLMEVLKDARQPEVVRCGVARNLGRFGAEAKPALPVFTELLRDEKLPPELAAALVNGLGGLGKDGVPALAEAVNQGNPLTRRLAIDQLVRLRDLARPALPALKQAAKDADRNVSLQAGRAARMIETGDYGGRKGGGLPVDLN